MSGHTSSCFLELLVDHRAVAVAPHLSFLICAMGMIFALCGILYPAGMKGLGAVSFVELHLVIHVIRPGVVVIHIT